MSISAYYKALDKFKARQEAERTLLLAGGANAADVAEFQAEEFEIWKANRNFHIHNSVSAESIGETALTLAWFQRRPGKEPDEEICDLLDSIQNKELFVVIKALKPGDFAMVEACLINGIPQNEYARSIGRSPSSVNEKLARLKKRLMKKIK